MRISHLFIGCFSLSTVAAGCAVDATPEAEEATQESRKKLGKGDIATGSCQDAIDVTFDNCGGKSDNGSCHCDELCSQYGDCCSDYAPVCGGNSGGGGIGDQCGGFAGKVCDDDLICYENEFCAGSPDCDGVCGPPSGVCDPTLICTQVLTCVNDQMYPTGCGPTNCDAPIGPCSGGGGNGGGGAAHGEFCGGLPGFVCADGLKCIEAPYCAGSPDCSGVCGLDSGGGNGGDGNGGVCNPTLICTQMMTCFLGALYPTGCGPANCDQPIGAC